MEWVKLGEIASLITKGTTPTTLGFDFVDEGINFIKIESISEEGSFISNKFNHITSECDNKLSRSRLQKNDLLFSIAGAIGRTAIVTDDILPANTNQALALIRIPEGVINYSYLKYVLQSSVVSDQFEKRKQGVAQLNISLKDVANFNIPLPSQAAQQMIVEILGGVEVIISLRKQQLAKLDELVKSRFVEMFGDPISNPKGWKTDTAEKHIDLLSGFPFDSSQYTESGVNICGGLIIMPQRIEWNDCKHWSSVEGYEEYTLKENDIVIALDRPWISEGFKIAMVEAEYLPALLIQRTARVRAISINQYYLMYCFLLGGFDKHCNVTGSLVPHISAKDIRSFQIMLPPSTLQEQFAAFVEQTDKSKFAVQQSIEKLETLKKSLMQQYFG